MQQSVVFFDVDLLHGLPGILLLQLPIVFRLQLLAFREQLLSVLGIGPQITGRAASSKAYTKMQIDNMVIFTLNSSLHLIF